MKKRILCGISAAMTAICLYGQSVTKSGSISPYSQFGLGILADQTQVTERGMAGTGIALRSGIEVNTLNPASYSAVDSLTMLFDAGLSGQITNFKEAGNSVNARSASFDYVAGLFRLRKHLGVSFGLLPFSNVNYDYDGSIRLDNTMGIVDLNSSGTGSFRQVYVGVGWNPVSHLSVGVNAAYLWGSYSRTVSSIATATINSLTKDYHTTINSYNLTFGLQWQQPLGKKDVLTLGATLGVGHKLGADATCDILNINTATLVSDTTSFTVPNAFELPFTYGVGMAWNHRHKLTLAADFTLQKWGSLSFPHYDDNGSRYELQKGLLSDRTRLSLGVDYVPNFMSVSNYLHRVHYRAGVAYTTPYIKVNGQDGPKQFCLSAGLGLPLQNKWGDRSVLNISAQWERTSASQLITENAFRLSIGLTFNERWFAKWRVE